MAKRTRTTAGGRLGAAPATAEPVAFNDLDASTVATFASERDEILGVAPEASLLPETEEAFYARDPFSADYGDMLHDRKDLRLTRVNQTLREDLLEKPYLMERPEEGATRGAAAVWRSLRAQLHGTSVDLPDGSDPEELRLLKRELEAHRMVVESLTKGLDGLVKRIGQRLDELKAEPAPPATPVAGADAPTAPREA
jgi:hypothetical protein